MPGRRSEPQMIAGKRDRLADPSITDAAEVVRTMSTDLERGLTSAEAARRLAEEGANELCSAPPIPVWRRLLAQFQDPLVYLLLGAIAVSLVAWAIEGRVVRRRHPAGLVLVTSTTRFELIWINPAAPDLPMIQCS